MSGEEGTNGSIPAQLERITQLLAMIATSHLSSITDRAVALHRIGLSPKQIAAICGTTAHSISVIVSSAKKSKRR